jgi:hypothetical protein
MNMRTRNMNNMKNNAISIVANIMKYERYKRGYKGLYQAMLLTRSLIQANLASL